MYPTVKRWKKVFTNFCLENLNLTDTIYTYEEDFKNYPLNSDAYCTGSDQVWNSKWNNGILPMFYLNFIPRDKFKFSFSASFGQDELSLDEVNATKKYLEEYNYISVREESGVNIIKKQYGIENVTQLLDPSLLLSPEFWRKYSTSRTISEDYILIYNLNRSKEFDEYAKKISEKTGLKLVRLCTRYDQFYRPGKSIFIPSVFEFISLIDNATYVLTDSFHATAFSMNMNTEPICIYPQEFGGRLESFLKLTESLQRHVSSYQDFDVIKRRVDFNKVNTILNYERKKGQKYIENVLKEISKYNKKGDNS